MGTAIAALAGVASAFRHGKHKNVFGCWNCNCGWEACEHYQSDCIFDAMTRGADELTHDVAVDAAEHYLDWRLGEAPNNHEEEANAMVNKLFDGRSEVNKH